MISLQELLSSMKITLSLESKPLKLYTRDFVQNIDIFQNQIKNVAIHKEKFTLVSGYLQSINQYIQNYADLLITLPFAKSIEEFNIKLKNLNQFALSCTQSSSQKTINDISLFQVWNTFLIFWQNAQKFIKFLDISQYFDPVSLSIANFLDVKLIKEKFQINQERLAEIDAISQDGSSFDGMKTEEYAGTTLFSTYYTISLNGAYYNLEVFNPDLESTQFYRKYVTIFSQMIHPNVLPYYGSTNSIPLAVLSAYSQNATLSFYLHNPDNQLSPTHLSIIMLDIARALQYLHSRKVCHRYLNLESIFLNENFNALLGGLWNSTNDPSIEKQIEFSPYTAPEVLLNPSTYNEKSDVYSYTILVWEMYMNMVPYAEKSAYAAKNDIIYQDLRLKLPSDPKLTNFFICGWSRNPNNRPTMAEIVKMIENQELLIPETDVEAFSSYVESTRRSHTAALKGILQLKIDQLRVLENAPLLDDSSVELLINVVFDSQDQELKQYARHLLIKNLQNNRSLTLKSLVLYCQLSLLVNEIQAHVLSLCNAIPDRNQLIQALFQIVDTAQAVQFMIVLGLKTEEDCNFILDQAENQTPAIAELAARAVVASLPHSPVIFDHGRKNPKYYYVALEHIKSLDDASLNHMSKKIVMFADSATPEVLDDLCNLVLRLDTSNNDFDPNCILFKLIADGGYTNVLDKFAANSVYCGRFIRFLLQDLVEDKPHVALTIVIHAKQFPETQKDIRNYNVPKLLADCIKAGFYDIAYIAAAKIRFTESELKANESQADEIVKVLDEKRNDEIISSILLFTLLPYCLYSDWKEKSVVPDVASLLLQSDNTLVASRALAFVTAVTQNPVNARIMALNNNLLAAYRFLDTGNDSFIYVSIRFFASIAPYLKFSLPLLEVVNKLIQLALSVYIDNMRFITLIIRTFLNVSKGDWGTLLTQRPPIQQFISEVRMHFSGNREVLTLVIQLENYK